MGPTAIPSVREYERPPVIEVCVGFQTPGDLFSAMQLGVAASALASTYPGTAEVQPLPPSIDDRDAGGLDQPFQFRLGPVAPPLPRLWLTSESGHYLVQLQRDRLMLNWRRQSEQDEYPRFKQILPAFREVVANVKTALASLDWTLPAADVVEVSYVNELASSARPEDPLPRLGGALEAVTPDAAATFLPSPLDEGYAARYPIDENGTRVGTLSVTTEAARRSIDMRPIYTLKLTALLFGERATLTDIEEAALIARKWVVEGFTDLTTSERHAAWGLMS